MRPNVEAVCKTMAEDLIVRVLPAIAPAYHQGTVGMVASLLSIVGEEWDRAASRRIDENESIRELFRGAAPRVNDAGLKRRLLALAEAKDDDFRISELEKNNCALRAALIDLHAHVEPQPGNDARQIETAIWRELAKSTERRRLSTAQF
ncbi:MAG: hypothetical protein ACREQR_09690 [Candidatus Binataceae bacterium]